MTFSIDTSHKSPNYSSRDGTDISMICLHATVGSGPSSLSWLCNPQPNNPDACVSTHYLIYKTGKIYQLVDDSEASWHAGKSTWKGLGSAAIQKCSLGVELENSNSGRDPYPKVQLDALRWLCQDKIARYHITQDMVVRHLDIATPKGRKTDPAGFPFAQFVSSLYAPIHYRPREILPCYQRSDLTGKVAVFLNPTDILTIDARAPLPGYAANAVHVVMADGSAPGFVDGTKLVEVH